MGASVSQPQFKNILEPLESRQLLSAAPSLLLPLPIPIAPGAIIVEPTDQAGAASHVQTDSSEATWTHTFVAPFATISVPLSGAMPAVAVIVGCDRVTSQTSSAADTAVASAVSGNPFEAAYDAARDEYQASLDSFAAVTGVTGLDDSSTDSFPSPGVTDAGSTSSATSITTTSVVTTPNSAGRSAGNTHAQPGVLHPTDPDSRGGGADNGSSDGAAAHGRTTDGEATLASTIVSQTHVGASGSGAAATASSETAGASVAAAAGAGSASATRNSAAASALALNPTASATFSILPLAIAEMTAVMGSVQAAVAAPSAQAFVQPAAKAAASVVADAVNLMSLSAVPGKATLINLFHVDSVATFRDAMGAFIDDSAARIVGHHLPSHSRAWRITAGAAAADLVLVGYWLAARRKEDPTEKQKRRNVAGSPFCEAALLPGS